MRAAAHGACVSLRFSASASLQLRRTTMKGDFTRHTFDPQKGYTSVRLQQGRVLLDADWNEQADIWNYLQRAVHRDIIGPTGAPTAHPGFELTYTEGIVHIGHGRFYVEGILAENRADCPFISQPYFPGAKLPKKPGDYIFYLDVWERHVTALEDSELREVALGGPDTTTRTQVVWQVRWRKWPEATRGRCHDAQLWLQDMLKSNARLVARAQPDTSPEDPCLVPERAGYQGLENQLYRVEIHQGGNPGQATFKWSRENGSVVVRLVQRDGNALTVSTVGRDEVLRFGPGDWVEVTDDERELRGEPGVFARITKVEGRVLTVAWRDPAPTELGTHPKVRRWGSEPRAVKIGEWIGLEKGIQVKFEGHAFRTGDWWTIPSRTTLRDILWPRTEDGRPLPKMPEGIEHHHAVLAIGTLKDNQWHFINCRKRFSPLTELPRNERPCCTVTVGDGVHSVGDVTTLQDAVERLRQEKGGVICLLPGEHHLDEAVTIANLAWLHIRGCGQQSWVVAPNGALKIDHIGKVRLEALHIQASTEETAVVIENGGSVEVDGCWIVNQIQAIPRSESGGVMVSRPLTDWTHRLVEMSSSLAASSTFSYAVVGNPQSQGTSLAVHGCTRASIRKNLFYGYPALVLRASQVELRENRIAGGGVWVQDGSSDVVIATNEIAHGEGPGILLGGIAPQQEPSRDSIGVARVDIRDNHIHHMQGIGITFSPELDLRATTGEALNRRLRMGELEAITITHNRIESCGLSGPDSQYQPAVTGGIVLGYVSGLRILHNIIRNNGPRDGGPAVGILVYLCEGLEAVGNRIENNGSGASEQNSQGLQGGFWASSVLRRSDRDGDLSGPAALIHDNIIAALQGPALNLFGFGPMSICRNHLETRRAILEGQEGVPNWINGSQLGSVATIMQLPPPEALKEVMGASMISATTHFHGRVPPLRLVHNALLFHDNQINMVLPDQSGHLSLGTGILVFGDASIQHNHFSATLPKAGLLFHVLALSVTLRISGNGFFEDSENTVLSCLSWATLHNNTTANQATHCILARGRAVVDAHNQIYFLTDSCQRARKEKGLPLDVRQPMTDISRRHGTLTRAAVSDLSLISTRRLARYQNIKARLQPEAPGMALLDRRMASLQQMRTHLKDFLDRSAEWSPPSLDEGAIAVRLVDENGRPVKDAVVELVDEEGNVSRVLGRTNRFGEFTGSVCLPQPEEGKLYLRIGGSIVSEKPVKGTPGRLDYFFVKWKPRT